MPMMKIFDRALGIEQGSLVLFSDFEDGGPMWSGEGPRLVRRTVAFSGRFREPPAVFITPEMWDYDCTANIRGDLIADNVEPEGFDAVFKVWNDTRIARLRVGWMAMGPLADDEDWDV